MFADNSQKCKDCFAKMQTYRCQVSSCGLLATQESFDKRVVSNANETDRTSAIVCLSCEERGCSPADVLMYDCVTGHQCGHLKFERQLFWDWKRSHTTTLRCMDCNHQCAACKKYQERSAFDKDVFENSRKHKRDLVCLRCQERGCSPKDVELYTCLGGHDVGHLKFNRDKLKDWKRGKSSRLSCEDCQKREKAILNNLREKGARKCTCRSFNKDRAYAALFRNAGHQQRCALFPVVAGMERWDGDNKGVTKNDLEFLVKIKSPY